MMINSSYSCYMLIMGQDADMIQKLKRELSKTFDMKNLGSAKSILGRASNSGGLIELGRAHTGPRV